MLRSYEFNVAERYGCLTSSLPSNTSIHSTWPKENIRRNLPEFLSIATTVISQSSKLADSSQYVLMGMPIHVVNGDRLNMNIMNQLPSTGLSIHFHGFEMKNAIEYDGVVGLTQCAVPPQNQFNYNFEIEETDGTYWYHTHSGNLGINSQNIIKGPLIVHPDTSQSRILVDKLHANATHDQVPKMVDYRHLLSYESERILFFSEGFQKSDVANEFYSLGGLHPPVPYNDDGFVSAVAEFEFGTVNGKLREVVQVEKGQTYTFRLLNGGSHFAFRISIDGLPMVIIAADSHPVIPYEVDEVILHNAERFNVNITIPDNFSHGDRLWIRADTLETRNNGFQNGIRAILHVVEEIDDYDTPDDSSVIDPIEDIAEGPIPPGDRRTMNCYSNLEMVEAKKNGRGGCFPITVLEALSEKELKLDKLEVVDESTTTAFHTVDFDVNPAPLHAYFTRIGNGNWYQHTLNSKTHFLKPDFDPINDMHPNSAIMDVPAYAPVIIIWRNRSIMEHPMHLHGYKMEILETYAPNYDYSCNLAKCELTDIFSSEKKMEELKRIPKSTRPIKDTFIMPAGGAVATRIFTRGPGPWLAHCHTEVHLQDGMAFIMNVGNYTASKDGSWLPSDSPTCDSMYDKTRHMEPHCNCYIDEDAVLGLSLDDTYKCSRPYLCMWQQSQVAVLKQNNSDAGYKLESSNSVQGWIVSFCFVGFVIIFVFIFTFILPRMTRNKTSSRSAFRQSIVINDKNEIAKIEKIDTPTFWMQFMGLIPLRWSEYRVATINVLRVIEVLGLGILTGFLFQDVGKNNTATGLAEKTSLLFFSTTLWCQTRMYPAVSNYYKFKKNDLFLLEKNQQIGLLPCFLSRMVVVIACESWWPVLFALCAYPLAAMIGDLGKVFKIIAFLILNNMSYIAIGGVFGTIMPTVNLGMIGATLFAQTTVICAGFFTQLPPFVGWIRYISPIFYAFKGIVKTAYSWDDTYICPKGHSIVGANQCYLETSPIIDIYKERGINVATFGDPTSSRVYPEGMIMLIIIIFCQLLMLLFFKVVLIRNKRADSEILSDTESHSHFYEEESDMSGNSANPNHQSRLPIPNSIICDSNI